MSVPNLSLIVDGKLHSPNFMKSLEQYDAHEEWVLACACMLHSVRDRIVSFDLFWEEEAPAIVTRHHRAFTDVLDCLEMYKGNVTTFIREEYVPRTNEQWAITEGVESFVSQMMKYLENIIDTINTYYEMGFFDTFDLLHTASREFYRLAFNPEKYDDAESSFILCVVLYYYHCNDITLPKVFKEGDNDRFVLDPSSVLMSVMGSLFKYFYVPQHRLFTDYLQAPDPTELELTIESLNPDVCDHKNRSFTYIDGALCCINCKSPVNTMQMLDAEYDGYPSFFAHFFG